MLKSGRKKRLMNKVKRDTVLLISILRQSFSGIRKAVYSSVKCFVNCVLNTKWAVSICKGQQSHINKLFLNSHAWPGNDPIRDRSQKPLCLLKNTTQIRACHFGASALRVWNLTPVSQMWVVLQLHLSEIIAEVCKDGNWLQNNLKWSGVFMLCLFYSEKSNFNCKHLSMHCVKSIGVQLGIQ